MKINIQPTLESETILLQPLQELDFEELYKVASDTKIWEQHPNKDRWQKPEFQKFFVTAIESKGAFKIIDKSLNTIIGSSRFYNYHAESDSILIGYTFYNVDSWGTGINSTAKKLMLDYIFQFVSTVIFHVGKTNFRSQIAVNRLGSKKIEDNELADFGELSDSNFAYKLNKEVWFNKK